MRFLEFGQENDKILVMFHASCMTWEFLKKSIEALAEQFHIIVPVMPGYDMENQSDYTSVEEIARETEEYLLKNNRKEIHGIYGVSMGGSIVIRMLANGTVTIKKAVIDAGITPYQMPAFLSYLFVLRDFSFMLWLKNSIKFFSMFVKIEKYGSSIFEQLRKVMLHASRKTIWNNFKSCNTYTMPNKMIESNTEIQYWYGSKEKWNRKRDIKYVKTIFPNIVVEEIDGVNHAEFVMLKVEAFVEKIEAFMCK